GREVVRDRRRAVRNRALIERRGVPYFAVGELHPFDSQLSLGIAADRNRIATAKGKPRAVDSDLHRDAVRRNRIAEREDVEPACVDDAVRAIAPVEVVRIVAFAPDEEVVARAAADAILDTGAANDVVAGSTRKIEAALDELSVREFRAVGK